MSRSAPGGLDEQTEHPEPQRPWWPAVTVLGGAALVGLVLRFYPDTPLWLDEALSVNIARLPVGEIPAALRLDGHPPLYYVLLHGWMSVFGESDAAVRAMPALFSVLTVPLLWWVLRPRGARVAWVAAGLLAASPFAIRYATEARMYSLVMLLVVAGWWAVERSIERPSIARLAGVAVCTGLLLLTHYWSMFLLAAVGIVLLWAALRRGVTAAWKVIAAMVVGGLAFLPWVPSFLTQLQHTGTPWGEASRPADVVWLSAVDFVGGPFSEPQLAAALLLALVVVGLFGRRDPAPALVVMDRRPVAAAVPPATVAFLTLAIGWTVSLASSSTFQPRYASFVLAPVLLLVAMGLLRVGQRWVALGLAVVLIGAGWIGVLEDLQGDRTQAGEIAAVIDAEAGPDDVVVFCPDQLGPAVMRELDRDLAAVSYPLFNAPERVDWTDYADRHAVASPSAFVDQLLSSVVPDGGHVWLVARDGYRTVEGQCSEIAALLGAQRGVAVVVPGDVDTYYEPSTLYRSPPRES
ncbi:MAG: glycosyltransferase family 39 protein [Acidimicrobiales bacterium]